MQPIKDRDSVHVILMEDGSYWCAGGFSDKGAIMTTLNLSSATFLHFEDACYKADKLKANGRYCEVVPVLIMVDD